MTSDLSGLLALTGIVWAIFLIGGIGFYVWYGIALSKLFPKLGAEGWKGWVPILNEYEILVRGGLPGWQIVFAFLPVVSLYYLYLKFQAATRIGQLLGRPSTGLAVVAPLVAPLWATLVQTGSSAPAAPLGDRVAASMTAPGAPGAAGGLAAPAIITAPGSFPTPAQPAPPAQLGATGVPPVPPAPPALPASVATSPAPPAPAAAPPAPAPPAPAPLAAPAAPPALAAAPIAPPPAPPALVTPPEPASASEIPPVVVHNPWAPKANDKPAPVVAPPAPPATPPAPPVAPPVAAPSAPVVEAPAALVAPTPPVAAPVSAPAPAPVAEEPEIDDDDEMGATIVVDRRPRVRWRLELDGGAVFALDRTTAVLGRKPVSSDPEVQDVAVPDTTRTLSKLHARLERRDEQWVITDLNSTNGVVVVDAAGEEHLLDPGASATITGRFILGKVGMRLAYNDGTGEWRS
ncbi:FHA domain-containing protein [Salinibacterium sp. ZJ77]|uniref:FHA domain-containing protein n=1 Tax=Salinibacterium sp. ZJ77 TaxID=2708337 RepID=UPI001421E943|nr:FHA domain-containing protein [Salinibacterium sp. ZJ77]